MSCLARSDADGATTCAHHRLNAAAEYEMKVHVPEPVLSAYWFRARAGLIRSRNRVIGTGRKARIPRKDHQMVFSANSC